MVGLPGSLVEAENGHITSGGDFERAKKFVSKYALPAGVTFGAHTSSGLLYVFGSGDHAGSVPAGVTYQRLQHPDGLAMTDAIAHESFDGKNYVIAEFAGGKIVHFYDGAVVTDYLSGIVRSGMTDNSGIAAHLAALINGNEGVTATSLSAVVTVTGTAGVPFTITSSTEDGGGTNNQTAVVATPTPAIEGISGVAATGGFDVTAGTAPVSATSSFTITGGTTNPGVNRITSITVDGVEILNVPVDRSTSASVHAAAVAVQINTFTSSPEYTAVSSGATVTISAPLASGSSSNGLAVVVTVGGDVTTTAPTNTAGGISEGESYISSVKVDGLEILGATVNWSISHSATATNIAAQINNFTSSPEYTATASGARVTVAAAVTGTAANGKTVSIVAQSPAAVGNIANMSGGVAAVSGQAQVSTVTIGGTFQVADRFTVTINGVPFGADDNPMAPGRTLLTLKKKMYSSSTSLVNFCAIDHPTIWNRSDAIAEDTPGAGFINMANQDEGSEDITALGTYQGNLVAFSRSTIQIEYVDVDPLLNLLLQPLKNTGTVAPNSVVTYGSSDTFYLDDTGIRSLRARDASDTAFSSDVGSPIDPIVIAHLKTLTDAQKQAACGIIAESGRFWLALGLRVYVFSYFPSAKISAWSYYTPGFQITSFVRLNGRIYARSGDTIYLYGGDADDTYPSADEMVARVRVPFLTAGKPATKKRWSGMDAAIQGEWTVSVLVDPKDEDLTTAPITLSEISYLDGQIPLECDSTHAAPLFVCSAAGYAKISSIVMHHDLEEAT